MNLMHIKDFSFLDVRGLVSQFCEIRAENDGNGNPIYVGYSPIPGAPTAGKCWYIVKLTYDVNGYFVRQQLPNDGVKAEYIWDSRASYFS